MTLLSLPDMTCDHCRATVERTVLATDPAARIEIDLPNRQARVETARLAPVLEALADEGYPASIAG